MKIEKLEKMQAEHEVHGPAETWREGVALFEIAIQLKRIADAMEKLIEKEVVIDGDVFGLAGAAQPLAVGDTVTVDNPSGDSFVYNNGDVIEWEKVSGAHKSTRGPIKVIDYEERTAQVGDFWFPLVWLKKAGA